MNTIIGEVFECIFGTRKPIDISLSNELVNIDPYKEKQYQKVTVAVFTYTPPTKFLLRCEKIQVNWDNNRGILAEILNSTIIQKVDTVIVKI